MGARFNEKERNVSNLMKKHWKTPKGNIIRNVAKFLDRPGIMAIVCRDGAAYVRPYAPLDPDSSSLKDTSIGIMLIAKFSNKVFELSPVEFRYINQRWWEAKINGETQKD
jgi:hypothetical protein